MVTSGLVPPELVTFPSKYALVAPTEVAANVSMVGGNVVISRLRIIASLEVGSELPSLSFKLSESVVLPSSFE